MVHWNRLFKFPSLAILVMVGLFVGWGFFEAKNWAQLGWAALACIVLLAIDGIVLMVPGEGEADDEEEIEYEYDEDVPDDDIPGTEAYYQKQAELRDLANARKNTNQNGR